MRKLTLSMVFAGTVLLFLTRPAPAPAGLWSWDDLATFIAGSPVDVHHPEACDTCDHEVCVERTPIHDCVHGKKKVYKTEIKYEYVSIPETRYRWKKRHITKKIPAEYCKTVCDTHDSVHCVETEEWDKHPAGCGCVHCKTCEPKHEKVKCKQCHTEPGKTTTTVHYKTCVKEAYTVYRQVRRPVCVKKPHCEHVEVPITRYECDHCNTDGCDGGCCESGCQ